RDFHVTGVQTCALPILPTLDRAAQRHALDQLDQLDQQITELRSRPAAATVPVLTGTGRTYGDDWNDGDTATRRELLQVMLPRGLRVERSGGRPRPTLERIDVTDFQPPWLVPETTEDELRDWLATVAADGAGGS